MRIKFVVLGDLHMPFHHKAALTVTLDLIKEQKPDYIIQVGDLYDLFSMSRFPKSQNEIRMTPTQELEEAISSAKEMWEVIRKYSPKSKCIQLLGNHDLRLSKQIKEKLPELLGVINTNNFYKFKGVKTITDVRKEFAIDGIVFQHGHFSKLGDHAKWNQKPTVVGHSHRAGTLFHSKYFEANAGFLADETQAALSYTTQRMTGWTLGVLIIYETQIRGKKTLFPAFIPYKL